MVNSNLCNSPGISSVGHAYHTTKHMTLSLAATAGNICTWSLETITFCRQISVKLRWNEILWPWYKQPTFLSSAGKNRYLLEPKNTSVSQITAVWIWVECTDDHVSCMEFRLIYLNCSDVPYICFCLEQALVTSIVVLITQAHLVQRTSSRIIFSPCSANVRIAAWMLNQRQCSLKL